MATYSLPMTNMITRRTFTLDEVREILSAIEVAEGEAGDLKIKRTVYSIYPELEQEHNDYVKSVEEAIKDQAQMRETTVSKFVSGYDCSESVIEQAKKFYAANRQYLRDNCSDDICFPGDLFRYLPKTILVKLQKELRAIVTGKNMTYYEDKSDSELWHELVHIMSDMDYKIRMKNLKN